MPYRGTGEIPGAERERELLIAGLSYTEVARLTGSRVKTISERNRLIHKINIWDAFERRIEREGIPCRLAVTDAFGYWFSGLFDGEGCIYLFTRAANDPRYREYRMAIRITLRDDDASVLEFVKDQLQVGRIARHRGHGTINPAISFTVEKVQDLAEVVVPLFERYPLHSKKRYEFAAWKPIVRQRYIDTLAGYSNRKAMPNEHRVAFNQALELIKNGRAYSSTPRGEALPLLLTTNPVMAGRSAP